MKKITAILSSLYIFCIIEVCFAKSTVHEKLVEALIYFESIYPEYAGKAYLTDANGMPTTGDGNRTWQQQMVIILERPRSYPNISGRFEAEFKMKLPASPENMTLDMLRWWEGEIMAQAGKVPKGFAHVGGKAQDVSVKRLDLDGKVALEEIIRSVGLDIIYEKPPEYYVTIDKATLFHCQSRY